VADHTAIEWAEATLNVVTGCTKVSEGCERCFIERTPPFRTNGRRFAGPDGPDAPGATTGVQLHPDRLTQPLRWRKPRRIFVCSLADLFHDDVPDGLIAALWYVMGQCAGCIPEQHRGHVFQVLTKRPARMAAFLRRWADTGDPAIPPMDPAAERCGRGELVAEAAEAFGEPIMYDWMDGPRYWPTALPGVWLGTSVENQRWADIRIPKLLECPAAVRFLSCEPLLGPIDLGRAHPGFPYIGSMAGELFSRSHIDWVIVGGESGPGARPMHPPMDARYSGPVYGCGRRLFLQAVGPLAAGQRAGRDALGGRLSRARPERGLGRVRALPRLARLRCRPGAWLANAPRRRQARRWAAAGRARVEPVPGRYPMTPAWPPNMAADLRVCGTIGGPDRRAGGRLRRPPRPVAQHLTGRCGRG
jgi:protein gp37